MKQLPKSIKALSHEAVVLECEVDADVVAYWTKDGKRIDAFSDRMTKYETKSKDFVHSLKVKDLTSEDSGIYAFVAGSKQSSTTLFVEGSIAVWLAVVVNYNIF